MTERPENLQRRLQGLTQIGEVVGALNAIASGQAAAARTALAALVAHAQMLMQATDRLRVELAPPLPQINGPGLLLVIGAAQGFSGAYPARIAEAALTARREDMGLLVLGGRTEIALREHGLAPLWSEDLPGHPEAILPLASRVTDALMALGSTYPGPIIAIVGAAHPEQPPETRRLFPPDLPAPGSVSGLPLLLTLPPTDLLQGLLQEALFAAVALALLQGVTAEATARLDAMARARNHLSERRQEVERAYLQARQEQITNEMIELSSLPAPG